jgi:hypothetical protein
LPAFTQEAQEELFLEPICHGLNLGFRPSPSDY